MLRKRWVIVLGVVGAVGVVGGVVLVGLLMVGNMFMDQADFDKEMAAVVVSDEAKKIYEGSIKYDDPEAFTSEGVIQSYEIDMESIHHNPMGGIGVTLVINGDKSLTSSFILSKGSKGQLKGAGDPSVKLAKQLDRYKDQYEGYEGLE